MTIPATIPVHVLRLPHHDPALPLPDYATPGAAAMDLLACLPPETRAPGLTLAPGARALVPTGLALKQGVTLVNAPGTIDADYRGELGVIVINHGTEPVTIDHGMRIAQILLAPVTRIAWRETEALGETARGAGGFGSTGTGGAR